MAIPCLQSSILNKLRFSLRKDKCIPEAVEFMIQVIEDEKSKALWGPAADSLGSAAARGNIRAKAAIDKFKEEVESRKKGQDTKP